MYMWLNTVIVPLFFQPYLFPPAQDATVLMNGIDDKEVSSSLCTET